MGEDYVPKVTVDRKYDASIDDYFDDAAWIWRRDIGERSVLDLWLHVVDHCARLVEAVRKERPRDVIDDLADTMMWLFSFLAQARFSDLNVDRPFRIAEEPSELIWNKFPAWCPACLDFEFTRMIDEESVESEEGALERARVRIERWIDEGARGLVEPVPCQCLSRIEFAEDRHQTHSDIVHSLDRFRLDFASATKKLGKQRESMRSLQLMFEGIFGNAYQVSSVQNIAFHLLEEVGEVSQALKDCYTFDLDREPFSEECMMRRGMKLKEEVADVFSWLHALMLKIKHVYYRDAQKYFESLFSGQRLVSVDFSELVESISLPEIIWAKYGVTREGHARPTMCCAGCFCAPCECRRDLRIRWRAQSRAESND